MEGNNRLGFENTFILVEMLTGGQRPEKSAKSLDVAGLLENLADAGNLLLSKTKGREHGGEEMDVETGGFTGPRSLARIR